MSATLLLPVVTAGVTLCGAAPAAAIAHGRTVAQGQYRFSAALTMTGIPTAGQGRRDSSCSGALIAPRWVITAGHCFRDAGGERVSRTVAERTTATVGRADLTGTAGHVATVIAVHQSDTADVALAEIDTPITDIEPLAIGTTPPETGDIVRLTGYGLIHRYDPEPSKRLQTGEFTVTSIDETFVGLSGHAPRPDTSPCEHDSGGPYFRVRAGGGAELVAVVSRGPACPHTGADLSARTDNLAGWISTVVGDRGGPDIRAVAVLGGLLLGCLLAAVHLARQARRVRPGGPGGPRSDRGRAQPGRRAVARWPAGDDGRLPGRR